MSYFEAMWFNFFFFVVNAWLATASWNRFRILNGIAAILSLIVSFIYLQLL